MKNQIKVFVSALVLGCVTYLFANPIVEIFMNEVYFESGEWTIELKIITNFDGWYLKTISDSAYFKNGLDASGAFLLINKDSMQSELNINPMGDYISLYEPNGNLVERIIFGGLEGSQIMGPKVGQSICHMYSAGYYDYYLDQSPTLGFSNDTLNANGIIEGYVCDSLGYPLPNTKIIYKITSNWGGSDTLFVLSDSNGYYKLKNLAEICFLSFNKSSYVTQYHEIQVWPDSICMIDTIKLKGPISNIEGENSLQSKFDLSQNYPNPFNPTTKIRFSVPHAVIAIPTSREKQAQVEITSVNSFPRNDDVLVALKIYDILGNEITTLVNEQKQPGTYEVEFSASGGQGLSSGIYFYKLTVGEFSETRKMVLLK